MLRPLRDSGLLGRSLAQTFIPGQEIAYTLPTQHESYGEAFSHSTIQVCHRHRCWEAK